MRFRLACAAMALCAFAAGDAQAQLVWDGVAELPATAESPGRYLICEKENTRMRPEKWGQAVGCYDASGLWRQNMGAPKYLTLQEGLDKHFKAPIGLRAVALGPLPLYDRMGLLDRFRVNVAYKLVKE